jgi:hypothetical protein
MYKILDSIRVHSMRSVRIMTISTMLADDGEGTRFRLGSYSFSVSQTTRNNHVFIGNAGHIIL